MNNSFDYLIVGSGLYGATFAYLASKQGKKCLVIDKRPHLGSNIYCENIEGINVHKYGAHIFHTSNKQVWNFVNSIIEFNRYTNSPIANYQGNAVVNYTERDIPYTRVIEHKHFEMFGQEVYDCPRTIISKDYSMEWKDGMEPYYPVNDEKIINCMLSIRNW